MKKNQTDRHLQVPVEANRDKHINFPAMENEEQEPADLTDENLYKKRAREDKGLQKSGFLPIKGQATAERKSVKAKVARKTVMEDPRDKDERKRRMRAINPKKETW